MFVGPVDEFVDWVTGERLTRYASTTHFLADPNIVLAGDVAKVDTYCMAHHITLPNGEGEQRYTLMAVRYLDRFERRDEWLIADRNCVFDWVISQLYDADSLGFPNRVTKGRRDREDAWYVFTDP